MIDPELLARLRRLMQQQRLDEAEEAARTALRTHPKVGILWKVLSVVRVQQHKDALPELTRAAELLPHDAEALGNLGSALHAQGRYLAALPYLERALRMAPSDTGILMDMADCLRSTGKADDAVSLYERVRAIDPRSAEAHNNLGNVLLESGHRDRAIACYRLALALRPSDAQILCNLSNALRQSGRHEEALATAREALSLAPRLGAAHRDVGLALAALGQRSPALESLWRARQLNPTDAEIHHGLGNVLRDLGDLQQAVAQYLRAVELEPDRAERYCSLGNALVEARMIDEAMMRYRQALALRPGYAAAHLGQALVLRQQRRSTEALVACRAALAADPDFPEALAVLGELEADGGRFDTAESLFRRALDRKPGLVAAISGIAAHRKMTADDSDWLQRVKSLAASRLPVAEEITLRYALGKYFDDVREFDQAFTEYHRANELSKRQGPPYDPDAVTQRVNEIIDSFGDIKTRAGDTAGGASEVPILIIGMPRSGTSLAEQILASHPEVFGGGEVVFWSSAYDAYRDAKRQGRSAAQLIPGFADGYLAQLRSLSNDAARIVDKMPVNFMYAGLIHAALPRARIIHLSRHPIDTCLSIYFQNFFNIGPYANDLHALAHYYGEYRRIAQAWRTILPASALLEVPYEGLVTEQERWTRRMLDFVGLPWDPRCLDFHRAERAVITASRWQVRQQIHAGSMARWRNYERHVAPLKGLMVDKRAAECAAPS
jgi:tetratricopeptide (TPR) repeat protein